jgi:hypothetical protein
MEAKRELDDWLRPMRKCKSSGIGLMEGKCKKRLCTELLFTLECGLCYLAFDGKCQNCTIFG